MLRKYSNTDHKMEYFVLKLRHYYWNLHEIQVYKFQIVFEVRPNARYTY